MEREFFEIFAGLPKAYGLHKPTTSTDGRGKREGEHSVTREAPTPELWAEHLAGEKSIGIFPLQEDGTVLFAAIDVDQYPLDHNHLNDQITQLKLPLILCRSKSGGAHLYIFFKEPIIAKEIRKRLIAWAAALGIDKYDIYPAQDSLGPGGIGNFINMPYFGGDNSSRDAIVAGQHLPMADFVTAAKLRAITAAQLTAIKSQSGMDLEGAPPCIQSIVQKLPIRQYRDNTLFSIGVYFKLRYPEEWKDKIDAFNREHMEPPLSTTEVAGKFKSLERKSYTYLCEKDPLFSICHREECETQRYGISATSNKTTETKLNLNLGVLRKFGENPATWIIEVDGSDIELQTDQLMSFAKFRVIVVEKLNKLPNAIPGKKWNDLIAAKLADVQILEAPDDAGMDGIIRFWLEGYCSRLAARDKAELSDGRVWWAPAENGGKQTVWFRLPEFLKYLKQNKQNVTQREVSAVLRSWGAKHGETNIRGKFINYWIVDAPKQIKEDENVGTD